MSHSGGLSGADRDYAGTAVGGLDWGVCWRCQHVDVACCCGIVAVAGYGVGAAGAAVVVSESSVVVAGAAAVVSGSGVVAAGGSLDWGVCSFCRELYILCRCSIADAVHLEMGGEGVVPLELVPGAVVSACEITSVPKRRRMLIKVEGGIAMRGHLDVPMVAGVDALVDVVRPPVEPRVIVDFMPDSVIVGAATARLDGGVGVSRIEYRRRFSFAAGTAVLVPRVIPDVDWTFARDEVLVRDSLSLLAARRAATSVDSYVAYQCERARFVQSVTRHLLARSDMFVRRGDSMGTRPVWSSEYWSELQAFPKAQLSAFIRGGVDAPRDLLEGVVWKILSRYCRLARSQLPVFVVRGSSLPPLSTWRLVAVAFAGAEVGCRSGEEHCRWIWLVRLVQGAAPVFCSARLAGLALLAGNRHTIPSLLACWMGITGEAHHFSGAYNLAHVARAVAWLHLRPCAAAVGDGYSLVPRVNLLELSVQFPSRLVPKATAVVQRLPVFDVNELEAGSHHVASCDYLDVARAGYDFAPSVALRRAVRADDGVDNVAYCSDLPLSNWETVYHPAVLAALPWVLGFVADRPCDLEDAGFFVPVVRGEEWDE